MRIALGIEYNGLNYYGWQAQKGLITIQGTLEQALSIVANESIAVFCAGRTDAQVHATGQVIHFDTHAKRHIDAWIWGTNTHLPSSIVVKWAKAVDYQFHARFSAKARRYRYLIYNHPIRSAVMEGKATWYYYPLEIQRMQQASQCLLGEHDFSSFRSSQCNSSTAMRNISEIVISRQGHYIVVEIAANAFLHHMVRNIVGSLVKVGSGMRDPEWLASVLQAKNRRAAAETAPAEGLYLIHVDYPKAYDFPQNNENLLF